MHKLITFLTACCLLLMVGSNVQAQNNHLTGIADPTDNTDWLSLKPTLRLNAEQFVQKHGEVLGLGFDDQLRHFKTQTDRFGNTHHRYQQFYKNIKVEGAMAIIHEKGGLAQKANGRLIQNLELAVQPILDDVIALETALDYIPAQRYAWQDAMMENMIQTAGNDPEASFYPEAELVIMSPLFDRDADNYQLAYKLDIYTSQPHERWHIYIDAMTGKEISRISQICNFCTSPATCTAQGFYNGATDVETDNDGNQYVLHDCSRNIKTFDSANTGNMPATAADLVSDADCNFTDDPTANDVHWATAQTHSYFDGTLGCNGFDCNGGTVLSWVHFGPTDFNNAFYNGIGFAYGDGNGIQYNAFTSLDIVAHEYTHGVTDHSAGLIYAYEPGALNESFSDIFAAVVEEFYHSPNSNWQAGDQWTMGEWMTINGGGLPGFGIRSMDNPNNHTDPDTYEGIYWQEQVNCTISIFNDNCGVHRNSGVQNHWFYLLSEGATGINDHQYTYTVNGIGIEKAAQVAYQALTAYLTPTSNYFDARQASIWAAQDLVADLVITAAEAAEVENAWCAVGVGTCDGSSIAITKPNGGETLSGGTIYEIEWNSNQTAVPFVKITYSLDNGLSWKWVTSYVENDGDYDWFVPNANVNEVLVRIQDADNPALMDVSDAVFAIDGCGVTAYFEFNDPVLNAGIPIICQGETVVFDNFSSGAVHYEWLINGEIMDYTPTFTHTFEALTGTKTTALISTGEIITMNYQSVQLIAHQSINDTTACWHSQTRYVFVIPEPEADFSMSLNDLTVGFYAPLTVSSFDNTTNYLWDFGDGATDTLPQASHTYATDGLYFPCLTMVNNCDSVTVCKEIGVNSTPVTTCDGTWVNYTNTTEIEDIAELNDSIMVVGTTGGLVFMNRNDSTKTVYTSANSGLSDNWINSVAIDGTTVWMGTVTGGLVKFDIGMNTWETYDVTDWGDINYTYNHVNDVLIDNWGNLWVAMHGKGLARLNTLGEWDFFNTSNTVFPQNTISKLILDVNGDMWMIAGSGAVCKMTDLNTANPEITVFASDFFTGVGLPLHSLAADALGNIWIGSDESIIKVESNLTATEYAFTPSNNGNNILLATDSNNDIWVLNATNRTFKKFDPISATYSGTDNLLGQGVYSTAVMLCDSQDKLWFGTDNQVLHLENTVSYVWKWYDTSNDSFHFPTRDDIHHSKNWITGVFPDNNGGMIFSINGGEIYSLTTDTIIPYNFYDYYPQKAIQNIALDKQGMLWVAAVSGSVGNQLYTYQNNIWTTQTTNASSGLMFDMAEKANNNVLIAGHYLSEYNPSLDQWATLPGLPTGYKTAVAVEANGDIWVGMGGVANGVWHWNGDFWETFLTTNSGLSDNYIHALEFDHSGNLWIATENGLNKYDGTNWKTYTTANSGLPHNRVLNIGVHSNGDLWIMTLNGLGYFNGTLWKNYTGSNSGLPDNSLTDLATDSLGNVYVASEGGLGILYNNTGITTHFTTLSNTTIFCEGQPSAFFNNSSSTSGTLTYTWLVNDVVVSNSTNLINPTFNDIGRHVITLIANNGTCENSYSQVINLAPAAANINLMPEVVGCDIGTVTLDAGVENVAAYSWLYNGVEVGTTQVIEVDEVGTYFLQVTDHCGSTNFILINVVLDDFCVYPGDVNYDGICNNYDLLALGAAYQETGSPRAVQLTNWQGYYCPDWTGAFPDNINYKHADCDGNGIVNYDDLAAIEQNYGEEHDLPQPFAFTGASAISLLPTANNFIASNDTITASLNLQNIAGNSAVLGQGMAFSIEFMVTGAHIQSANIRFDQSMGIEGMNTMRVSHFQPISNTIGRVEVGIIKTDGGEIDFTHGMAFLEVDIITLTGIDSVQVSIDLLHGALKTQTDLIPINQGSNTLTAYTPPVVAQAKAFLQGAYTTTTHQMTTALRDSDLLPNTQPFNRSPWNYTGTEGVQNSADLPINMVDWVLVEARDANNDALILASRAAFLLADGSIVSLDPSNGELVNGIAFSNLAVGTPCYLVLRHRNHLDVMSSQAITLPNAAPYDFSTAISQVMGEVQMVEVSAGVFALLAGDIDGSGVTSVLDFNYYTTETSLLNQYVDSDCNLDKSVSVADFNLYLPNSAVIGVAQVRY